MHEFNDRVEVQRRILEVVNGRNCLKEQLCGLTQKAIERWISINQIAPEGEVAGLLLKISSKLCLLSSKSQEQVSGRYGLVSAEIEDLTLRLRKANQKAYSAKGV